MALTIKQATWGDETSTTDITSTLQSKASSGYIDVIADNSLVPAIPLNLTVAELTDEEKAQVKKDAIAQCGNENDQKCIAERTNTFQAAALQKKVAEQNSSKNIITGRRLTVTYVDASGVEKTMQIPDGQKLTAGKQPVIKTDKLLDTAKTVGISILMTFLWVFSIVVTYRTFIAAGWVNTSYVLTAIAALVPYSGLLITPIGFLAINYFKPTAISTAT
jgi:hypothetical protein